MTEQWSILVPLLLSAAVIFAVIFKRGIFDPLAVLLVYYFLFSFGPVINYLFAVTIYFGVKTEYIPEASWIFFVSTLSLGLVALFLPLNRKAFYSSSTKPSPLGPILLPANLVMAFASLALIMKLLLAGGGGSDKLRNIGVIGGGVHYLYLLIELYLTTFFFNIGQNRADRLVYGLNFLTYIAYCLLIGERDFIFTLLSIGLHWSLARPAGKRQNWKLLLGGGALAFVGTSIFFLRDSTQTFDSPLSAFLSQGSLLFVNTFTLYLLDHGQSHFFGLSYGYALLNLLPSIIWTTGFNMPEWFRSQYAPGSTSGYGYGLDAEGFLNFSWPGVVLTFIALGLLQRKVFNLKKAGDFVLFYSVFNFAFTMYGIRNDSTAFLKGHFYALISYAALYFLASLMSRRSQS